MPQLEQLKWQVRQAEKRAEELQAACRTTSQVRMDAAAIQAHGMLNCKHCPGHACMEP